MTTLTLVADPTHTPPRVIVTVASGSAATFTAVDVRREGEMLRGTVPLGLNTYVVDDFEASYGVATSYTVTFTLSTGTSGSVSESVTLSPARAWLIHPRTPDLSVSFTDGSDGAGIVQIGDTQSDSQASRHRVLSASRDVVMSFGTRSDPSYSSFQVATTTAAESSALESLLKDETPVLLRIPASWGLDFKEGFYSVLNWTAAPLLNLAGTWLKRWTLPLAPANAPRVIVQAQNTYADGLLLGTYADDLAINKTYYDRLVVL